MNPDSKRQDLPIPAALWVVATPIGNLEDLSPRARRVLAGVPLILCEDTRRTRALLSALGISGGELERLDAHAEARRIPELVERLRAGEPMALVSDAGTPAVSDPGARLVRAAREAGARVLPVPGPSAVSAMLSVAGAREGGFAFLGFFPRKTGERRAAIEAALADARVPVSAWFESPERIEEVVSSLEEWCAGGEAIPALAEARVFLAKEMTKTHEEYLAGAPAEVAAGFRERAARDPAFPRGEWCIALESPQKSREKSAEEGPWSVALRLLIDAGVSASEAAKLVSKAFGVAKNQAYESALRFSGKK